MNNNDKIKLAKQAAIIAGAFTAVVGLLLLLNYMQMKTGDPLNSIALKELIDRLSQGTDNGKLLDEIRQLDLLARKAYFTSLWQIKTGAYLMIAGAVVFIFAMRTYSNLSFSIDKPSDENINDKKERRIAQRWISISGVTLLILAGASAIFSINYLKQFDSSKVAVTVKATGTPPEQIEITTTDKLADTLKSENQKTQTTQTTQTAPKITEADVRKNHNSFRGAWGNGIGASTNLPVTWNGKTGENILWKTEIPVLGYNSPILWNDKIFLSGASKTKRVVYCIDRNSGKILWEHLADNIQGSPATQPKTTDDTGLAAPTLTTDGGNVYALFGNGDILALDMNGNRMWAKNLGVPDNHYGHASSLITWDGKLFIQYDTHKGGKVFALNTANGQSEWTTARRNEASWASPILAKINGKIQLVLLSSNIAGYDISNGKELWSLDCMSGEVGPSPAFGGGLLYAANENARMVAVNPITKQKVWESNHYLPEVASPLYNDGLLYIATTYAVVACFDALTGELAWEYEAGNGFYSSPEVADGKLYFFDIEGKAYIFKTGKEQQLIGTPELGEKVFSTPVFADGRIYIRGLKYLYCIGTKH